MYPYGVGPPVHIPRFLEAYILSRMRSAVIFLSNFAKDMRMLSIMRPAALEVAICWVTDTNDTPCCSKSLERSVKSQRGGQSCTL